MTRRRVLIGSTEPTVVTLLGELVQQRGLEWDAVETSADLLLQLLESDYELVVLDLDLPCAGDAKMVGVLRRIRPKIPLVVLSSNPSVELGGRVVQEGVAYYSVKPVAKETLQEVLDALLAQPP